MALTLDDCDRMAAAVAQAGVNFMMAFQMRHDPSNRKIKELLEQELDPPATAADGRRRVEMVLGAYRSAQEGRRVHFPL